MICIILFNCYARALLLGAGVLLLAACATTMTGSSGFNINKLPSQNEIARRLAQGSMPRELRRQIIRLYSRDPVERAKAASHLGRMQEGAGPAVSNLIQLLPDDTPVQLSSYLGGGYTSSLETTPGEQASHALAEIGDQASNALILALNDPRPRVRRLAIKALGQIGDISAADFLIRALNDPDRGVRATAAIALGNYRHPMAVQKIMDAYPKASVSARTDMIYALANINDILAVPFLIKQAKDPNSSVRAAVMLALGKLGDARAIPALLAGLKDRDEIARVNAAYSLGSYYSPKVITALVAVLHDPAKRVRRAAVDSLKRQSGMDFGMSTAKWQQWWQQQRRQMQQSH
ncbi:MAG: HEAT repeat domain-containing protein [Gammaproteobacteria bacterium]|jgi:HEAT repeat protein